jgi:hypothetical protein
MTLILWKGPVVDEPDDAARLLAPYYERSDDTVFESSLGLAKVSNELRRRYPAVERGPWADDLPPKEVDRVLVLEIRWSADAAVLVIAMGIVAAGVFLLGWRIQVPVLDWILMIVGGFFFTVILFLLGIFAVRPDRR